MVMVWKYIIKNYNIRLKKCLGLSALKAKIELCIFLTASKDPTETNSPSC